MGFRRKIRRAAQRLALGGAGSLMGLVGIGFLSAALWLYLAMLAGAILACVIVGCGFLGFGLVLMMLAAGEDTAQAGTTRQDTPKSTQDLPPLASAFMHGMEQGMAARNH